MNRLSLLLLFLVGSLGATIATEVSSADQLWEKAQAALKQPLPSPEIIEGRSVLTAEVFRALAARNQAIGDALMAFIEQQPTDPRRWEAIVALARNGRFVIKELGDVRTRGWEAVVHDEAAETAWMSRARQLVDELVAAPGVPENVLEGGYDCWVDAGRATIRQSGLADFRRRLDAMRLRFPEHPNLKTREWQYLNGLRRTDAAAVEPWLHQVAAWPNATLSNWAKGELATEGLRRTPVELKFTALDGREVDLAKLRGKVVLVDFWATWCGPCKGEIPNVKKVYAAYHDRGFEVVGVSLDKADDRQKLADYCREHDLPWPQHFDGRHWQNEIAAKYSITAIPAMFLFGPDGRLVTTNARGPKLEAEVKRLLKL